jgi:hypothetical protein
MNPPDLVLVYVALDSIESSAVTGILDSAGIDARVRDLTVTPYPVSLGPLGERHILVPADRAAEAQALLRTAREDGYLREGGILIEDG